MNFLKNNEFLNKVFLGNTIEEYIIALMVFVVLIILFSVFQKIILKKLEKIAKQTKTDLDDAVIEIFKTIRPPFYSFLSFFIALNILEFPDFAKKVVDAVMIVWIIFLLVNSVQIFLNYTFKKKLEKEEGRETKSALRAINLIAKITIWSLGILLALSNLGVNVNSLIAGLGVGGVAIAFALQNILADLFSSFAIYFDKPFVVGDFIVIGDKSGTVEKIGIKTTRLRSLQGEEIVISNQELTNSQIQNFKRMKKRRITFKIGVTYETEMAKLKKIPVLIKRIINEQKLAIVERVNFKEFSDSSLDFEAVYYLSSSDYSEYMKTQEKINYFILEEFLKEGIDMAYPTTTVRIVK